MPKSIHFKVLIILDPDAIDFEVVKKLLTAIKNVEGVLEIVPGRTVVEIPTAENEVQLRLDQRYADPYCSYRKEQNSE